MKKIIVLLLLSIIFISCGSNGKYIEKVKNIKMADSDENLETVIQSYGNILEFTNGSIYSELKDYDVMHPHRIDYYPEGMKTPLFRKVYQYKIVNYVDFENSPIISGDIYFSYFKNKDLDNLSPPKVDLKWSVEGNTKRGKIVVAKTKNYKLKIETFDNGDYPEFYGIAYYDKNGKEISHDKIKKIYANIRRVANIRNYIYLYAKENNISIEDINEDNINFKFYDYRDEYIDYRENSN